MKTLILPALFATAVLSQPTERVLPFHQLQTASEMNEAATVIRSMGEIRNLSVQAAEKTLTVAASPAQAELAEWLLTRIDRTGVTSSPPPSALDFRPVNGSDSVVRILYFKNLATIQERNEAATFIRSLIEIPSLFVSQAAGAMVVRGTVGQADAARWAFEFLDRKTAGAADRYRMAGGGDDTIRLIAMPNKGTVEQFYRHATAVRIELQMPRFYPYSPLRVIGVRGTEELVSRAAEHLGKP